MSCLECLEADRQSLARSSGAEILRVRRPALNQSLQMQTACLQALQTKTGSTPSNIANVIQALAIAPANQGRLQRLPRNLQAETLSKWSSWTRASWCTTALQPYSCLEQTRIGFIKQYAHVREWTARIEAAIMTANNATHRVVLTKRIGSSDPDYGKFNSCKHQTVIYTHHYSVTNGRVLYVPIALSGTEYEVHLRTHTTIRWYLRLKLMLHMVPRSPPDSVMSGRLLKRGRRTWLRGCSTPSVLMVRMGKMSGRR